MTAPIQRLLVYTRRFPPDVYSGSESVIWNLWRRAVGQLAHVQLVAGYRRSRALLPPECVALDFSGEEIGTSFPRLVLNRARAARALRAAIAEFKPDVILSNSVEIPYTPVPTVLIVHDFNFNLGVENSLKTRISRAGRLLPYWVQSRWVERVVGVSRKTRDDLLAIGCPEERIRVVQSGVDTDVFRPPEADFVRLVPADPGVVTLGYVARLVETKGQLVAIAALRALLAAGLRVRLVLVGAASDPVFGATLREQARGLPVTIVTDVADVVPWYQSFDIVVFPTLMQEGFGLSAVEAMAVGLPVVHSDDPAINEATAGLGRAFPRGDAAALAAQLEPLIASPALRAELGDAGRQYAVENYDWGVLFRKYLAVLEEARAQG